MSSTTQNLLRAIAEQPDSEEPRLVLADWLEDQGDPQGEFIRVQMELASSQTEFSRRNTLESRQLQLLKQNIKHWTRELRTICRRCYFDRGLVTGAEMDTLQFLANAESLFEQTPLCDLRLRNVHGYLDVVAEQPNLRRLRTFGAPHCYLGNRGKPSVPFTYDWSGNHHQYQNARNEHDATCERYRAQSTEQLQKFLDRADLPNLRRLLLNENMLGDGLIEALARSDASDALEVLDLRANGLTHQGISMLALDGAFPKLTELRLSGCHNISHNYEEEDYVGPTFRELAPLVNRLKSLEVSRSGMLWDGAEHLAQQYVSNSLSKLNFHGSLFYTWGEGRETEPIRNVLQSELLIQAQELDIGSSYFDTARLAQAVGDGKNRNRECLFASNNPLTREAGKVLANANFPCLRKLWLDAENSSTWTENRLGLGNVGAADLFASDHFPYLGDLSLRRHNLTGDCWPDILDSPFLKQLFRLNLANNGFDDQGLQRLLDHGPWESLAELNLRHNKISKAWKKKLIDRFGYKVLV